MSNDPPTSDVPSPFTQTNSLTVDPTPAADTAWPASDQEPADVYPARIGRFAILDVLGQGGMGRVYAAYDPELDRRVALKVLLDPVERPEQTARIRREAHAMARLSHPNVCPVYEVGDHQGQTWIAMEYVDGGTLRDWQAEPRAFDEVLGMYARVGAGLAAAHDAGMLHRDFKPYNVLVGRDGRPRIIDFGLVRQQGRVEDGAAHPIDPAARPPSPLDRPLTRMGTLMGTPAYMAPEQLARQPVDARCDQFAFCVALYEALYNRPPFDRRDLEARARDIEGGPAAPPPTTVPPSIHAALVRGLAAEPTDRWPSMTELLGALGWDPDSDRTAGVGARLGLLALLAGLGLTLNLTMGRQLEAGRVGIESVMVGEGLMLAALIGMGWLYRDRLFATAYNRRQALMFLGGMITMALTRTTSLLNGFDLGPLIAVDLTGLAGVTAIGGLMVARWLFWLSAVLMSGAVAVSVLGSSPTGTFGLCIGVSVLVAFGFYVRDARRGGARLGPTGRWASLASPGATPGSSSSSATGPAPSRAETGASDEGRP